MSPPLILQKNLLISLLKDYKKFFIQIVVLRQWRLPLKWLISIGTKVSQKEQKIKFAHVSNSYHGDTLGAVSIGGIDLFHQIYKSLFETIAVSLPDSYRHGDQSDQKSFTQEALYRLEKTLSQHADELAGFILEPLIQGCRNADVS